MCVVEVLRPRTSGLFYLTFFLITPPSCHDDASSTDLTNVLRIPVIGEVAPAPMCNGLQFEIDAQTESLRMTKAPGRQAIEGLVIENNKVKVLYSTEGALHTTTTYQPIWQSRADAV